MLTLHIFRLLQKLRQISPSRYTVSSSQLLQSTYCTLYNVLFTVHSYIVLLCAGSIDTDTKLDTVTAVFTRAITNVYTTFHSTQNIPHLPLRLDFNEDGQICENDLQKVILFLVQPAVTGATLTSDERNQVIKNVSFVLVVCSGYTPQLVLCSEIPLCTHSVQLSCASVY